MDQAAQKGAGGQNDFRGGNFRAVGGNHTRDRAVLNHQILHRRRAEGQIFLIHEGRLHGLPIELAVRLRARTPDGGPLAPIQKTKLNARRIGHPAHHAVQRINFPHQMSLPQPANGRVAGHFANSLQLMGDQQGLRPESRGRRRRFAACVPSSDDDDIKFAHKNSAISGSKYRDSAFLTRAESTRENVSRETSTAAGVKMFHVKHQNHLFP